MARKLDNWGVPPFMGFTAGLGETKMTLVEAGHGTAQWHRPSELLSMAHNCSSSCSLILQPTVQWQQWLSRQKMTPRLIHNVLFPRPQCRGPAWAEHRTGQRELGREFLWPLISAFNHFLSLLSLTARSRALTTDNHQQSLESGEQVILLCVLRDCIP